MEYFPEHSLLLAYEERSDKHSRASFKIDPDVCSWNKKKYPSIKDVQEFKDEPLFSNDTETAPKFRKQSGSKYLKKFSIKPEMNQVSIAKYIIRAPSPEPDQSPFKTKFSVKSASIIKRNGKKNVSLNALIDFSNNNLVKPCYTCKLSNLRKNQPMKKSITRACSKEKSNIQSRMFFGGNSDAPDKISEILTKARVQSPSISRYTLKNKLPIYAAKTLEELLANSKLSQSWRRKSHLRPRYFS